MSWDSIRFGNLYSEDSRNGLTKPSKVRGSGYKMINMGELFANDRIYDIPMELVPLKDSEKKNAKVEKGDLLFARQSLVLEGAGKCCIVMDVSSLTVFESHLIRVRLDKTKANPLFYYYYFKSPFSPVSTIVSQCAQAGIRGSDLQELDVSFPPLPVQDRIASILTKYDELIENNQKQIKLLEEAAQRIRFPGHENTEILDGIPAGWRIEEVGKLIGKVPRTTQIMTANYHKSGKIPIIDQSKTFIAGYTDDETALVDLGEPVIVFGDHTRILKYIQFPFAKGADGTQLIVSANKNMPQSLLYCGLVNIDLSNYHYARHFKYLKAESLLVPIIDLAKQFDEYAGDLFKRIQVLRDEISSATEARDRLLPKLMSGEIEL